MIAFVPELALLRNLQCRKQRVVRVEARRLNDVSPAWLEATSADAHFIKPRMVPKLSRRNYAASR
jgi:hypothetical protein